METCEELKGDLEVVDDDTKFNALLREYHHKIQSSRLKFLEKLKFHCYKVHNIFELTRDDRDLRLQLSNFQVIIYSHKALFKCYWFPKAEHYLHFLKISIILDLSQVLQNPKNVD